MNKLGFTTVELILTMTVVIIIMATISGVTYTYRDISEEEKIKTDIVNYKNTVTKVIYDDILDIGSTNGKVTKIVKDNDKYNFVYNEETNSYYSLEIIDTSEKKGIKYNDIEYIIPDSKNINYEGISMYPSDNSESDIYSFDIIFSHKALEDRFKIHLIVSK